MYKFSQKWKENSENTDAIARPMQKSMNFGVSDADKVFFGLATAGWTSEKYSKSGMRYCINYVYEFVCQLNANICPPESEWPENFVSNDYWFGHKDDEDDSYLPIKNDNWLSIRRMYSVFSTTYQTSDHKQLVTEYQNVAVSEENCCAVKEHEMLMVVEADGSIDDEKLMEHLPPTLTYSTGRFKCKKEENLGQKSKFNFSGAEVYIEENAIDDDNETVNGICQQNLKKCLPFAVVLKVYVCYVNGVLSALVNNLKVVSKKVSHFVQHKKA